VLVFHDISQILSSPGKKPKTTTDWTPGLLLRTALPRPSRLSFSKNLRKEYISLTAPQKVLGQGKSTVGDR